MKKRVVSTLLALAMIASLAACGGGDGNGDGGNASNPANNGGSQSSSSNNNNNNSSNGNSGNAASNYTLDKIVMVVDGTLAANSEENQDAFEKQWEAAVGTDLEIVQLDHSGYKDAVGRRLIGGERTDVILLSADQYAQYATTGLLWDMTSAYEGASFQSRMQFPEVNEAKKINGKLYGFAPAYGNGCVTYVKKAWLDAVGLKADDIKDFASYYDMLKKFTTEDPDGDGIKGNTYGVVGAGYVKIDEAPYIMYMPEFWQDAYPAILQDANGKWYDGFNTDATKGALKRLRQAYVDGVMHPDTYKFGTGDARKSWFSADQVGSEGVFTYWAGTWYQTLTDNLVNNGVDAELVQLAPIAEVGAYINRDAPVWCIIDDQDGDNSREQAIFNAFIDTMMDGDTVQMLWTYGAEDVHWSTKAESFQTVANKGKENEKITDYSYEEGQFHLKTNKGGTALWKKNAIDPALSVCPLTNGYFSNSDLASAGNAFFLKNCKNAPIAPSSDLLSESAGTIQDAKSVCIADVVQNGMDVDAAMKKYTDTVGSTIDAILAELNAGK